MYYLFPNILKYKSSTVPKIQWISVILLSVSVIKTFWGYNVGGTCSYVEMLEGVRGQRKVGNLCSKDLLTHVTENSLVSNSQ